MRGLFCVGRFAAGLVAFSLTAMQPAAAWAEERGVFGVTVEAEGQPGETGAPGDTEITEEAIDAYFDGSVFVGDSVMVGFRNYAQARPDTYLGRLQFLAAGSFSTFNALRPVTSNSTHPVYQGQRRLVWESIAMMQAKRVFLFFGLNDLGIGGVEATCARYVDVVSHIRALNPEIEVHIISMTYTLAGKGKGILNNDNIRLFNLRLQQISAENGWGYVNLADVLSDGNGGLAPQYCSDHYVHQTRAAYDVWSLVLRQYAKDQIQATAGAAAAEAPLEQTSPGTPPKQVSPVVEGMPSEQSSPETGEVPPEGTEAFQESGILKYAPGRV